jgi:recombination protein RecR
VARRPAWRPATRTVVRILSRTCLPKNPTRVLALSSFAPPVQRLVTELSKLPGIGNRTAQRLAFHILRASSEDALGLAEAIREVKEKVGLCEVCFNLADEARCRICQDQRRDPSLICVVEEPSDVIPMERTHEFHGLYHVLGGALSPIDGVEPEDLKIEELYARVAPSGERGASRADVDVLAIEAPTPGRVGGAFGGEAGAPAVREVVLATNPTTTGEATALHIAEELRRRAPQLTVTRLASGLPVGSDLEYADEVTLGKALAGRRSL